MPRAASSRCTCARPWTNALHGAVRHGHFMAGECRGRVPKSRRRGVVRCVDGRVGGAGRGERKKYFLGCRRRGRARPWTPNTLPGGEVTGGGGGGPVGSGPVGLDGRPGRSWTGQALDATTATRRYPVFPRMALMDDAGSELRPASSLRLAYASAASAAACSVRAASGSGHVACAPHAPNTPEMHSPTRPRAR